MGALPEENVDLQYWKYRVAADKTRSIFRYLWHEKNQKTSHQNQKTGFDSTRCFLACASFREQEMPRNESSNFDMGTFVTKVRKFSRFSSLSQNWHRKNWNKTEKKCAIEQSLFIQLPQKSVNFDADLEKRTTYNQTTLNNLSIISPITKQIPQTRLLKN